MVRKAGWDFEVKVNPIHTTTSFLYAHWQWIIGTILGTGIIGWAYGKIRSKPGNNEAA